MQSTRHKLHEKSTDLQFSKRHANYTKNQSNDQMGRWVKPEVYPLMAAMSFVAGMCVFQLTRNILMNPDVRVNKAHRKTAVLENQEEGEKYTQHGLRRFLRTRPPEVMPSINRFFAESEK